MPPPAPSPTASFSLPSLTGPIGLLRTSTADIGPLRQLRFGLHGEYFGANDFLIKGDADQRLQGGLVLGYTPHRSFEVFAAILNGSNRNQRMRDPTDRDPVLIKTFGDLIFGGKGILPLSPAATLGFELALKFLSGVSDLALSPGSTSLWLGPLFTYDMRRAGGVPLRLHASASFFADNSSNLQNLSGVTLSTKEVAMFAYGITPSRLRLALAVDAPLENLIPEYPVDAFLEYHLEYVTSDGDRDFRGYMTPYCGGSGSLPCIDNRDIQWLTLGARADVYRGLTVDLGIDIRIRSAGFPYGPPVAPYNVVFGVSYPLDLDALVRTVVVTRTVEKPAPASTGQVVGTVKNARAGTPIAGAIVAVAGRTRARAASDADGGFASAELPPGPVEMEVSAPGFEATKVATTVVAGKPVEVEVALEPSGAKVHGRVADARGQGVEATIKFGGQQKLDVKSGADGSYATSLPLGLYQVRVDAPGLAPREVDLDLQAGQDKPLDFVLRAFVSNPNVVLSGETIKLKQPIRFVGATAKLTPASEKILDAVADVLDLHSEIKHVQIVAHRDSSLSKADAAKLTQTQADEIRGYLVAHGIAAGRLMPVGSGSTKPLVPNLGPANRARNRRVELHLE